MALTPSKVLSKLGTLQPLLRQGELGELSIKLTDNTQYRDFPRWRIRAYVWGYDSYKLDITQDTSEEDFKYMFNELKAELKR